MLNRILNLIIATCLTLVSFGQIGNVSGVVSDSLGQKIMGAAIVVKGTNSGSITDENGNYRIFNVNLSNATLVASYSGYKTIAAPLLGRSELRAPDVVHDVL